MPRTRTSKCDEDLRFLPASEEDSDADLLARADRLMRAAVSGGAARREETEEAQPSRSAQ